MISVLVIGFRPLNAFLPVPFLQIPPSRYGLAVRSSLNGELENKISLLKEKLARPPDAILDAVDQANGRLSVSDAASIAGMDLERFHLPLLRYHSMSFYFQLL